MAVTPRSSPIAPSLLGARTDSLEVARRHRVALLGTIHEFERALAVPAAEPGWRRTVASRLSRLRQVFAEHIAVTEGESGLYAELLVVAPRLARAVRVLIRQHAMIARSLDGLAERLREPDTEPEQLRVWASDVLRQLSRHRQRGADLVYEAYATDIGGET